MARVLYPAPFSVLTQSSLKQQAKISTNVLKVNKEATGLEVGYSHREIRDLMLMLELRKKIIAFRDILDLPPCADTAAIAQLIMQTLEDLKKLYPSILPNIRRNKVVSLHQELCYLYEALKSIGDTLANNHKLVGNSAHRKDGSSDAMNVKQLGGQVIEKLDNMIKAGRENFDIMNEDKKSNGDVFREMSSDIENTCPSPASVPPELMKLSAHADISISLLPLLQAVEKCISLNIFPVVYFQDSTSGKEKHEQVNKRTENFSKAKRTSEGVPIIATNEVSRSPNVINPETNLSKILEARKPKEAPRVNGTISPPPPPPTVGLSKVSVTGPPPPPPPVIGVPRFLRLKRSISKLKRSSNMGNLYRTLKRKLEGSNINVTTSNKIKPRIGGVASTKQGMGDALAEMTKRSAYFHKIEEDVQKHSQMIMKLKGAIYSFKTKDMAEVLKFHGYVEEQLEELSDETQVLSRFEDFPTKKLESLRTAAALHSKLEGIAFDLENWKIEPPLEQLLDKVESYFNKIKGDIEALDRSKDEDSKNFRNHDIDFDFKILIRIKELMVDVSSGCMELTLKERREATEGKRQEYSKLQWRAFQLAFRVYTFAGGQDDRAERLTKELGRVLDTDAQTQ